jgi:hypothetical protein
MTIERRKLRHGLALLAGALAVAAGSTSEAAGWMAGTGRVAITPRESMWMAGYAARTKTSEGVLHDLWAKALVLEDPAGARVVIVTLDLCGIGSTLSNLVRDAIQEAHRVDRTHVVLACSHTHSGPVVRDNLITMYGLDAEQTRRVETYSLELRKSIASAVGQAMGSLEPAELAWATGCADFAVNRRTNKEADVPALRERLALQGPTDHDVPVLSVRAFGGRIRAVVFGYACHCTVLSAYQLSGDYAGFAQLRLEEAFPGAQAMFVAGCGADQNPLPRRSVEHAESYGKQLAGSVEAVLGGPMRPVSGALAASYEELELSFAGLPTRAQIEAEARSSDVLLAGRAKSLLSRIEADGKLPPTYPYPVQVWRLGDDLTWILLGGEVVVDYSLRLKRNLGSSHTWVSSYCNDVMAYIPSVRVLKEGGYEGATSMIAYGLPSAWSDRVEDDIIQAVGRGVKAVASAPPPPARAE